MADKLHLTVVTPERALIDETVDRARIPGLGGYLGVLPGHAPLFSELQPGILTYETRGQTRRLAIFQGFVEVLDNAVRVLADVAENPEDIDAVRAAKARSRAEERIAGGDNDTDYDRAQAAIDRAATRLQVAGNKD